jgi:hypothetical protein
MPIIGSEGAASSKGFGFTIGGAEPVYIESIFSTYLYTGNGSTQTITNDIDLAGKGGTVFIKSRINIGFPSWFDTLRGPLKRLQSSSALQEGTVADSLTAFNSDGFSVGSALSASSENYAGWTFRKQPKFFDVVTYTGTGSNTTFAHNLGAVPGCIIVKRTDTSSGWRVYHRSLANTQYMALNISTGGVSTGTTVWNSTTPTSTVFSVGTDTTVNASGGTYVAYLFAHDDGGFGLTGTDNVISCGSYTGNGSATGPVVSLGYEPQWLMVRNVTGTGNWQIIDSMRGMPVGSADATLQANLTAAETSVDYVSPTATGFQITSTSSEVNTSASTYIYIAIRRGPMAVPTTGTSVFGLNRRTGTGANATVTGSAGVSDAVLIKNRGSAVGDLFASRLTGTGYMETSSLTSEVAAGTTILQTNPWDVMDGVKVGTTSIITNDSVNSYINYLFDRAPGFFDVVCYTGTGSGGLAVNHNLSVTPEWVIIKRRDAASSFGWFVIRFPAGGNDLLLNSDGTGGFNALSAWSSTTFTLASGFGDVNASGGTYVAYLFASAPGVSKVGSFTGTGATQVINCGFTGGARFVLIKATSTTGNWLVWDSARGIVAGNDPYLALNSTAAEVINTDWVDTAATGFELSNAGGNLANSSGVTYIFLAIA